MFSTGVINSSDRSRLAAVAVTATTVLLAGCGGASEPLAENSSPSAEAAQPQGESGSSVSNETEEHKTESSGGAITATIDAGGRKWLTPEVPYDVFPGLPTEQELAAAGPTAVDPSSATDPADVPMIASVDRGMADPLPTPAEPTDAPPVPMARVDDAPAETGEDWTSILPLDALRNEISSLNNDLARQLLTVGSYNDSFGQVSADGWVMSALATIAAEYPAPISWKENALLARDAAVAVAMSATARGRARFSEVQLANEQLSAILNNNVPPGLPDPDPQASREETADRAALMLRMQTAFDRLKAASGDEAAFAADAAVASHEAMLLAALAKFTAHRDYGSAEEPDYQEAARQLVSAGNDMAAAVAAEDLASFKSALDGVSTSCNACHQKYRFGN